MKLSVEILKKLGACEEAINVYRLRQEADPVKAIKLLIDGCEETADMSEKDRLLWSNWFIVRILLKEDRVKYAIFAAEQVIEIFEKQHPGDKRPRQAIAAAKQYLAGEITSYAAARAADAAARASYAAARAADAAARAAYAAAADAAYAAAYAAAADAGNYNDMLITILRYGITLLEKTI